MDFFIYLGIGVGIIALCFIVYVTGSIVWEMITK